MQPVDALTDVDEERAQPMSTAEAAHWLLHPISEVEAGPSEAEVWAAEPEWAPEPNQP